VPPLRIVEAFDVIEHICLRIISAPVRLLPRALGLERREEALHRGIVPDVPRATHRADDAVIRHQPLELSLLYWADSTGRRNTTLSYPVKKSSSASAGVFQARVLRGLVFSA
jgi:hypothetical protein